MLVISHHATVSKISFYTNSAKTTPLFLSLFAIHDSLNNPPLEKSNEGLLVSYAAGVRTPLASATYLPAAHRPLVFAALMVTFLPTVKVP